MRIAARYQQDGTLVAVRIWASSDFNKVWLSPEGHVLHVDATNDVVRSPTNRASAVQVTVDDNTQFFFRTPANALADATPIGTGTAFLAAEDLVRGFKVHVSVVDPLATPLVAQSIDIETAAYAGRISNADTTGFTYTRQFLRASDDYSVTLDYIDAATRQRQRWQRQRDHRLQVVELHLPDPADERWRCDRRFRRRHQRCGQLRRHASAPCSPAA